MKKAIHILMWIHFIYLLLLPTLAVVSAIMLFPAGDFWTQVLILGFPAVVTYCLFLANGYTLPESLPIALFLVLAVPVQVGLGVYFFGGGSVWLFFAESAAVEISSFVIGMIAAALVRERRKGGGAAFVLILLFVGPCFIGGSIPHLLLAYYGYGGLSLWLVPFSTAFVAGLYDHYRTCRTVLLAHDKHGGPQSLDMRYDGGVLFKLLKIEPKVPMLSPLWSGTDRTSLNARVHIFGWTAMFLPVPAAVVASLVLVD